MLTPSDIRNRMLKTTMGGYNKKDTDDFLDSVYQSFETIYKENKDLKDKVASLSDGVQYYKQMENTLQKALILAEKTSTETQEAAKEEAAKLVKEAKEKADVLLNDAKSETDALRNKTRTEADTLMSETKDKAESILEEARIQSDLIMTDAKAQAEITKLKARHDFEDVQKCMGNLIKSYENYYSQLKNLVSSQMELLESDDFKLEVPDINNITDENTEENEEEKSFSWNSTGNNNISSDSDNTDDSAVTEEVSSDGEDIEKEQDTPFTFIDTE